MLSITLCRFSEGVIATVVPGHTCTLPPLDSLRTAVPRPAVIDEPGPPSFSASANGPAARTSITTGFGPGATLATASGSKGEALRASAGFLPRCITRRLPAPSQRYWRGGTGTTNPRAPRGVFLQF